MTVILLRHGRSTANTSHVLAGRSPGVELDELGHIQAKGLIARLSGLEIAQIVHSPLLRCLQTVTPLATDRGLTPIVDDRLAEVDYGQWTGRELSELVREPLWKVVQQHASAAVFPGGEGLAQVQVRASPRSANTTSGSPSSTAAMSCGSRAATATSSNPCSPMHSPPTWTASSGSSRNRPPSASSATPRPGRSYSASTTPARIWPASPSPRNRCPAVR